MCKSIRIYKYIIYVLFVFFCSIGIFAFFGCAGMRDLDTPSNLSVDEYLNLTWNEVEGAEGYSVMLGEKEYETQSNSLDLFYELTDVTATEYKIKVKAYGNKYYRAESEYSDELEYTFNPYFTIGYLPNDDGASCTITSTVSKGVTGSIVIPSKIRGLKVTKIRRNVFEGAKKLKTVYIPDSVAYIENGAFKDCGSLQKVRLPKSLERINGGTFYCCLSLTTVDIPESVNFIGMNAFNGCTSLKSLTMPKNVEKIESNCISGCDSLESITVSEENAKYKLIDECVVDIEKNEVVLGYGKTKKIPEGVSSIGDDAFNGCHALNEIYIPASVQKIGYRVFNDCTNLSSIVVDENNPVYKGNGDFLIEKETNTLIRGCKNGIIPDGVVEIRASAFSGIEYLEKVVIPNGVKNIGSDAFSGIGGFKELIIPTSVEKIGNKAFEYCKDLENIYIPETTWIGNYAFVDCNKLTSVTVSEKMSMSEFLIFGPMSPSGSIYYGANGFTSYVVDSHLSQYCSEFKECNIKSDGGYPYVYSFNYINTYFSGKTFFAEYDEHIKNSSELMKDPEKYAQALEKVKEEMDYLTNPRVPLRLGYTFKGWATDESSMEVVYPAYENKDGIMCAFGFDERERTPDNTVLFAVWEKNAE